MRHIARFCVFQQVFVILISIGLFFATVPTSTAAISPVPFINNPLVPTGVAPGSPGFTLTVNGTGFTAASVVRWNGSPRKTTFVSGSQLLAAISAPDIVNATTVRITVGTPAPGGGTSNQAFFAVTKPSPSVSFSRNDYASVRDNIQIVTADFNRDGLLDLATASFADSRTATFAGKGDGTFNPYQSYSIPGGDHSLTAADFNRDGITDVAVALRNSGEIGVLLGKCGGGFSQRTLRAGLSSPYSLAVADFNSDGQLDLVAANETGKSISIFIGKEGGFRRNVDYAIGRTALSVAVGDFNQDGHLDLAVSTSDDDLVTVLLGNGDGSFQSPSYFVTGNQPAYFLLAADVNGDTHLDLISANLNGHLSVLLGNGDGTFPSTLSYASGGSSISAVAADLNGDGKLDLATANYDSATISVLLGNGNGTFQNAQQFPAISGARGLAFADFNLDGEMDLAVGNQGASSISVFLQNIAPPPPNGNIYVVDTDNSRVQVFDAKGAYMFQYGHSFDLPTDITLDGFNNSFVKDGNLNCHVDKFDNAGNFLLTFGACSSGGIGPGIFDNTGSVVSDSNGNVWVTSPDFYYMQKYDSTGHFQSIVCMANVVPNCPQVTPFLVQPQGIEIDSAGNIYVTNAYPFSNGFNVVKFDSNGNYLSNFGSAGSGNGQFNDPEGLAFDAIGNIYVADAGNNRVQMFDKNGIYLSQFGTLGSGNGQFLAPLAIALDSVGNIYVTDDGNNRVQKFDANGNYQSQFGSAGNGNGQFNTPYGIAISK